MEVYVAEIVARQATESEEKAWREYMGGEEMDKRWLADGDDPYDLTMFLVPISDEDEEEPKAEQSEEQQ